MKLRKRHFLVKNKDKDIPIKGEKNGKTYKEKSNFLRRAVLIAVFLILTMVLVNLFIDSKFNNSDPDDNSTVLPPIEDENFNSIKIEGTAQEFFDFKDLLDELSISTSSEEGQIKLIIEDILANAYIDEHINFEKDHYNVISAILDSKKVLTITIDVKTFTIEKTGETKIDELDLTLDLRKTNEEIENEIIEAVTALEVENYAIFEPLNEKDIFINRENKSITITATVRTFTITWSDNAAEIEGLGLAFDFKKTNEEIENEIIEAVAILEFENYAIFEILNAKDIFIDRENKSITIAAKIKTFVIISNDELVDEKIQELQIELNFKMDDLEILNTLIDAVAEIKNQGANIFNKLGQQDLVISRQNGKVNIYARQNYFTISYPNVEDRPLSSIHFAIPIRLSGAEIKNRAKERLSEYKVEGVAVYEALLDSDITINYNTQFISIALTAKKFEVVSAEIIKELVVGFDFRKADKMIIEEIIEAVAEIKVEGFAVFEPLNAEDISINRESKSITITATVRIFTITWSDNAAEIEALRLAFDFKKTNEEIENEIIEAVVQIKVEGVAVFEALNAKDISISRENKNITITAITKKFKIISNEELIDKKIQDTQIEFDFKMSNSEIFHRLVDVLDEIQNQRVIVNYIDIDRNVKEITITRKLETFKPEVTKAKIEELEFEFDFRKTDDISKILYSNSSVAFEDDVYNKFIHHTRLQEDIKV